MSDIGPTKEEIDRVKWFHTIEFPNGVVTPGGKSAKNLATEASIAFKYSITGKTVLDVGAWNGYFTLQAVKRGASRVKAVDAPTWLSTTSRGKESFDLVTKYFSLDVDTDTIQVENITPENTGVHDVVLFLGVLYHLKWPLFGLHNIARVCREHLVLETHIDAMTIDRPAMIFYPGAELNNDRSNWWGPNVACVEAMLKTVGFADVETIRNPDISNRAFFHAFKPGFPR
jgi:tRNA (mo5U34)-methyltransferase